MDADSTRGTDRKAYIHVVQTSGYNANAAVGAAIKVTGETGDEIELKEGDGAYIFGEAGKDVKVQNIGGQRAELLLFDVE